MKLVPLGDRVVLKQLEAEETTIMTGIIIAIGNSSTRKNDNTVTAINAVFAIIDDAFAFCFTNCSV